MTPILAASIKRTIRRFEGDDAEATVTEVSENGGRSPAGYEVAATLLDPKRAELASAEPRHRVAVVVDNIRSQAEALKLARHLVSPAGVDLFQRLVLAPFVDTSARAAPHEVLRVSLESTARRKAS